MSTRNVLVVTAALSALITALTSSATDATAAPPERPVHVFVAGDSTASIYAADEAPRAGWGQALPVFLNHDLQVVDEAISGSSSKSFIALGGLKRIEAAISAGDYLLISFGHNDEKIEDPARGTDPYTTYQDYLREYIDVARSHGATPVLVTSVERRRFAADGTAKPSHGVYPDAMVELGRQTGVAVVDLTTLSRRLWQELGPVGTQDHFLWLAPGESPNYPEGVSDNTHFQAKGAIEVARLVARQLKDQRILHPDAVVRLGAPADESRIVWPLERPV
jgi:lysophospholipase L1-like esterase